MYSLNHCHSEEPVDLFSRAMFEPIPGELSSAYIAGVVDSAYPNYPWRYDLEILLHGGHPESSWRRLENMPWRIELQSQEIIDDTLSANNRELRDNHPEIFSCVPTSIDIINAIREINPYFSLEEQFTRIGEWKRILEHLNEQDDEHTRYLIDSVLNGRVRVLEKTDMGLICEYHDGTIRLFEEPELYKIGCMASIIYQPVNIPLR
uniref:Uncharacterized protein n=1 Tax=viral metagenome TaxID=1070528 RepID=A0A6C0BLB0_9ZZZZ